MTRRIIEEVGLKAMEHCSVLIPVLLAFMKDPDPLIARQSVVSLTRFFCGVLEEMALQVSLSISLCMVPTIQTFEPKEPLFVFVQVLSKLVVIFCLSL